MTEPTAQSDDLLRPAPAGARRRIVVAMSGGVDSSVVAGILRHQGHDVIGITLQLYDHGAAASRPGACCAGQDIHDARRVAEHLGIPHYVLDYETRFRERVMQSFADAYAAGETPIPCVTCNQEIKFKDLLATADELGADALATGHYVARRDTPTGPALYRARDAGRDQSYFLFATNRTQLARLLFPLGDLPKSEVRALAHALGLAVAEKADSQDICFVPSGRYSDVIERLRPDAAEPGPILHVDGRVLGEHRGIIHYTVGQRRGLGIAGRDPLFVVRLDPARRAVVVGPRAALATTSLVLRDVNWLGDTPLDVLAVTGGNLFARIRSTHSPVPARIEVTPAGDVHVHLDDVERGVASGQACVLYQDGSDTARVLGGGTIARTITADTADTADTAPQAAVVASA